MEEKARLAKQEEMEENDPMNPRPSSILLQIPRELRDRIFTYLFASTRVSFGQRSVGRIKRKTMISAPNPLALLYVCRQTNQEAKTIWLGNMLFSFESPESLLDKMSAIPLQTLCKIRHIRTSGNCLMLQPLGDDDDVYYRLGSVLTLLPVLNLDTLTVLGLGDGIVAYDTLEGLVKRGNGWRELRFITPNSEMLGFAKLEMLTVDPYWRKPQPGNWAEIMRERDGAESMASVIVYQSNEPDTVGMVTRSQYRHIIEQKGTENPEDFGIEADIDMMTQKKELLVVVKRGKGVNISEEPSPPFHSQDIRHWSHPMRWPEIKNACAYVLDDSDSDSLLLDSSEEEDPIEVDEYTDVDDVEWPDSVSW